MTPFGIVMTNWNKERYVGEAIDSVLAQADPDWELVVFDDGSTDGSVDEIMKRRDSRIIFVRGENRGPGLAHRTAMEIVQAHANVAAVGILDSDDTLHPNAVKIVRQAWKEHPECGLVYTQNFRCDPKLTILEVGRARPIPEGETVLSLHDRDHYLRVNHWLTFTVESYKRTAGFAPLARHQDMDLIFKLEEVTKLFFVDQPLYFYRLLEDGLHTGTRIADFASQVKDEARARRASR